MLARTDLPPVEIPGPKAPPLVGPMGGLLQFFADPVGGMLRLHREHGALACVVDRNPALVCAFGAELNKAVITRQATFEHLSEIPIPVKKGSALARLNNTVVFKNGEDHRNRRRLLMPAFSKSAVEGYAPQMVSVVDDQMAAWPIGSGSPIDVAPLLRDTTAAIALRCLFGLKTVHGLDALGRMEIDILATIANPLAMLLPFPIPGTPYGRATELSKRIEKRIRELVAEKRADPAGTDALSRLIHFKDEEGKALTDDDLVSESNSLFAAGFDTSAHTLSWMLMLLAAHPEVRDAVIDEVRAVLGGEAPRAEHLASLVQLDRAVTESMRLLPVAVLLFMRVVAEDAELGGRMLPKGAQLILSPLVTHRDPVRFPAPNRFHPSRWEALEPSIYEYLPFGGGARMCIGASFATTALRLTLARILQRARPTLPKDAKVDYAVRGPALGPKGGLRLDLRRVEEAPVPGKPTLRGTVRSLVEV